MSNYKVPMRMCVACRQMFPKGDLIRVTRTPSGEYNIDRSGKATGRGAYVCNNEQCIAKCSKAKLLNKAYHANIPENIYNNIKDNNE